MDSGKSGTVRYPIVVPMMPRPMLVRIERMIGRCRFMPFVSTTLKRNGSIGFTIAILGV